MGATDPTLADVMRELYAIRRELAATRTRPADPTLALFLAAWWAFNGGKPSTATELLDAAAYGRVGPLLDALAAIHGDRGDPAKRLGRWLERHAGREADGLCLVRVRREAGAWLYQLTKV